uniref:Uncharacterized protein n=1 Tax=Myripristis murdjan TaxID=586833 RepID=A0A667XH63_9TELE
QSSSLRELDLSNNQLQDSGVKLLSAGLENCVVVVGVSMCRLSGCLLTQEGCASLASALSSNPSHLRELDLSYNHPGDSGVKLLSAGLEDPTWRLEALRLSACLVSQEGCASLASALSSNPSHLRELDLSYNHPGDSGVKLLSAGLEDPTWRLEDLRYGETHNGLSGCNLSERSCAALASVLSSQSSSLRELDLSNNDLQDSGVMHLSAGLESPHCRLEALRSGSENSRAFKTGLNDNIKPITHLNICLNEPNCVVVFGVSMCRLSGCLLTQEGCASLASALSSNPSHLRELDLSYNHPGDSGVKLLSAGLEDPTWRLEALRYGETHTMGSIFQTALPVATSRYP